ncbi:MAG: winged helix-turn-helix transcriptional regulator [Alphaproteobacteria bacterium]|nr:winged helix-turn-helix transcriptional regulator [Alphaproteobacteria bacterium]
MTKQNTLAIDLQRREAKLDGRRIEVTGLNLEMLLVLAQASPANLSPSELAQRVWQREHVASDTISKRISLLRAQLAEKGFETVSIETLPGPRYQLLVSSSPQQVGEDPEVSLRGLGQKPWRSIGLAFLGVAALLVWVVFLDGETQPELVSPDGSHVLTPPD